MHPNAQLRSAVHTFYAWLGSIVVLGAAPIIAHRLLDRGTAGARIAAVVIGVAGLLPWLAVLFVVVRRGDEFVRRMHLIACSIAFGGALVLVNALDWLVRAHFIEAPDLVLVWFAFLVLWLLALLGTKRHFERSS